MTSLFNKSNMARAMDGYSYAYGIHSDPDVANCSRPHTPPYTPARNKRPFERGESPASSIHPTETISPAKKSAKHSDEPDTIKVEELEEGDLGSLMDADIVYPDELEEAGIDSDGTDISDSDDGGSDSGMAQRFSRLYCEDAVGEAEMHKLRRRRRLSKRLSARVFKRSHSESVKSDTERIDMDAVDDHDLSASARRLRRRTQGPGGTKVELIHEDSSPGSPSPSDLRTSKRYAELLMYRQSVASGDKGIDEDMPGYGNDDDGDDDEMEVENTRWS